MTVAPPKPPRDGLEALIKEARERRRRRQLLGAAGVAIAAALALGFYAVVAVLGHKGSGDGSPATSAPLCRRPQLKTVPIGFIGQVFDNGDIGGLEFTNTSRFSCSLPGAGAAPRVDAYFEGTKLSLTQLPANGSVPNRRGSVIQVLAPGERAYTVFSWRNWCGPPARSAYSGVYHVTLRYSFRGGLVLAERGVPVPGCTAPESPSIVRAAGPLAANP